MTLREVLLKLARATIEERFGKPFSFSREILESQFPELMQDAATFVTIKIDGDSVRGCIGSVLPHTTLYDDVIYNAKAAAFEDKRFFPLSENEYQYCSIEISQLNIPKELEYVDAQHLQTLVRPKVDGILLQQGNKSATFLPQVWGEFTSFEYFFGQLGVKAGLKNYALDEHPKVFSFQVSSYEDTPLDEEEQEIFAFTPCPTPQEAETAFYKAFEAGDLKMMEALWADDENITCIHPAGEQMKGREAVMQSWKEMFSSEPNIHFVLEDTHCTQGDDVSIHTLKEKVVVNGDVIGLLIATNIYKYIDEGWYIYIHHASPDPRSY